MRRLWPNLVRWKECKHEKSMKYWERFLQKHSEHLLLSTLLIGFRALTSPKKRSSHVNKIFDGHWQQFITLPWKWSYLREVIALTEDWFRCGLIRDPRKVLIVRLKTINQRLIGSNRRFYYKKNIRFSIRRPDPSLSWWMMLSVLL